jgi:hypothetical protein
MKTWTACYVVAVALLAAGCQSTRSISNSGHRELRSTRRCPTPGVADPGFAYRGELSEFDVLGVRPDQTAFDEDIQQALQAAGSIQLKAQSTILLIQSGAIFPDSPMVEELGRHFHVVPFSGMPPRKSSGPESDKDFSLSKSLRLVAARAGAETILCYWGILESAQEKLATKTVNWVPVLTWFVPDERQHMRLRLKLALVDVRTGNWSVLSPPALDSHALSVAPRRAVADQRLVERLKQKSYLAAVEGLLNEYGGRAAAR